jgi:hypothetical protein
MAAGGGSTGRASTGSLSCTGASKQLKKSRGFSSASTSSECQEAASTGVNVAACVMTNSTGQPPGVAKRSLHTRQLQDATKQGCGFSVILLRSQPLSRQQLTAFPL